MSASRPSNSTPKKSVQLTTRLTQRQLKRTFDFIWQSKKDQKFFSSDHYSAQCKFLGFDPGSRLQHKEFISSSKAEIQKKQDELDIIVREIDTYHAPVPPEEVWLNEVVDVSEGDKVCQQIESDLNYRPNVTNQALLSLVMNERGEAKHVPRKMAVALQPADMKIHWASLYQVQVALKSPMDGDDYPVWHVESIIVLVNDDGKVTLHSRKNAEKLDFENPLMHLDLKRFLNCECLHASSSLAPTARPFKP